MYFKSKYNYANGKIDIADQSWNKKSIYFTKLEYIWVK